MTLKAWMDNDRPQQASTAGAAVTCPMPKAENPRDPHPGMGHSTPRVSEPTAGPAAHPRTPSTARVPPAVLLGLPPGPAPHLERGWQRPQTAVRRPTGHRRPQNVESPQCGPSCKTITPARTTLNPPGLITCRSSNPARDAGHAGLSAGSCHAQTGQRGAGNQQGHR